MSQASWWLLEWTESSWPSWVNAPIAARSVAKHRAYFDNLITAQEIELRLRVHSPRLTLVDGLPK